MSTAMSEQPPSGVLTLSVDVVGLYARMTGASPTPLPPVNLDETVLPGENLDGANNPDLLTPYPAGRLDDDSTSEQDQ